MPGNKPIQDKIAGCTAFLVGVISVVEAIRLYPMKISPMVGDHTMPALLGSIMMVLSLLLIFLPSEPTRVQFPDRKTGGVILVTMLIMLGYWIAMKYLGYVLSTLVASLLLYRTIGGYPWIKSGIMAFVTTAVMYTIFGLSLHMVLPEGLFPL